MTKNKEVKSIKSGLFSKGSWYLGAIIGLMLSSLVVFAALSIPHLFSSGEVISSDKVNQNFAAIEDEVNSISYGVIAGVSTDVTVANASTVNDPAFDIVIEDSTAGAYNPANSRFTVPAGKGGFYKIAANIMAIGSGSSASIDFEFSIDGGTTWSNIFPFTTVDATAKLVTSSVDIHVPDSTTIRLRMTENYGCGQSFDLLAAGSYILIKKIF